MKTGEETKSRRTGPKRRLIYILAASHSGSTLLSMLLGAHEDICTIGELKATALGDTDRYLCSCLKPIKECEFWTGISHDMARRGFHFDIRHAGTDIRSRADDYMRRLLNPLHRGPFLEWIRDQALAFSPKWRSQLFENQALNAALVDCICTRTNKRVIVDSSKIGIRLKYLLRNPSLDVKVIRLVRDGRAVSLTYVDPGQFADARERNLRGGGAGTSRETERLSMEVAAHQWRRSNEEADAILRQLDASRWIEVRYETLCSRLETTLQRLFSFIGVDPSLWNPDFRSQEHHIVGNGMRLDSTCAVILDERWKSVLNERELEIFESAAGSMNRRFGYL